MKRDEQTENFILSDKTDVDKVFLWGHNLRLKKDNTSFLHLLSQYSAYRKIAITTNRDLSIILWASPHLCALVGQELNHRLSRTSHVKQTDLHV